MGKQHQPKAPARTPPPVTSSPPEAVLSNDAQRHDVEAGASPGFLDGLMSGPFGGPVDNALEAAFGPAVRDLPTATVDPAANEAIGARASTEGAQISLGRNVAAGDLGDREAMETVGEEVAHALAGGGSGMTWLDAPDDPGEDKAESAGARFASFVTNGGPVPSLSAASGGRARIHRREEEGEDVEPEAPAVEAPAPAYGDGDGSPGSFNTAGALDSLEKNEQRRAAALTGAPEATDADRDAAAGHTDRAGMFASVPNVNLGPDGITGAEIQGLPGWVESVAFDGSNVSLGFARDQSLTLGGHYTDSYREVQGEDGVATGSYLDTSWGLDVGGVGRADQALINGSYGHEEGTRILASQGENGEILDREALEARAAMVEDTTAEGTRDEVALQMNALVLGMQDWGIGDTAHTYDTDRGSLGISRPGLVGAGISFQGEARQERLIEMIEGEDPEMGAIARVTLTESDMFGGSVSGTAGFGALSATLGGTDRDTESQTVDFAIETPEGARDFALNHFTGLMPGAAEMLGIETMDDAAAFIAAGGMDNLANWDGVPEDFAFGSTAEMNAFLIEQASTDADFAAANGYVSISELEESTSSASLNLLGIDLASASTSTAEGQVIRMENGVPVTEHSGSTDYSQSGLLVDLFSESGREGSRLVANEDGRFAATFYGSFEEDARDATGAFADAYREEDAVRELVDDPTYVRTLQGDLGALGEAYADMEIDEDAMSDAGWWLETYSRDSSLAQGEGAVNVGLMDTTGNPELVDEMWAAAEAAGMSVEEYMRGEEGVIATISAVEAGEMPVEALDSFGAQVYVSAALNTQSGDARFHAIAQLASHPDPAIAAQAMATLAASGDSDVIDDFADWVERNPELQGTVSIEATLVAGSEPVNDALAALDAGLPRTDDTDQAMTTFVDRLEASGLEGDALEEALAGFDASSAGNGQGGLERIYSALPPSERARFAALAAESEIGQSLLLDLAAERPEMLIDPSVPMEDRAAWAEENLGPIFDTGAGFDAAAFVASAEASQTEALQNGDASGLGPRQAAAWNEFVEQYGRDGMERFDRIAEERGLDPGTYLRDILENPWVADNIWREFSYQDDEELIAALDAIDSRVAHAESYQPEDLYVGDWHFASENAGHMVTDHIHMDYQNRRMWETD